MSANPFDTLGLEPNFDLDVAELERRHRELSKALHPDRYVGRPPQERRQALNRAIEVNEAFRCLKDPITRGEALLAQAGHGLEEGQEPKADPALLMEMMEKREALAEARSGADHAALSKLSQEIESLRDRCLGRLAQAFAQTEPQDPTSIARCLGELRYYRRFLDEVAAIEDELF